MKKLISLVLVLCMACMLIPAMAEDESVVGTWYLSKMNMSGLDVNPADLGMEWTMTFGEDGTFVNTMSMMGENQETTGTWALENGTLNITTDGNTAPLAYADGTITIDMGEEGSAVFTKEAPQATAKATVIAAESEDAFLGDWDIDGVDMMGMYMTKEMLNTANMGSLAVKMTIVPGKATIVTTDPSTGEEQSMDYDTTFADGKLNITVNMGDAAGDAAAAAESAGLDLSSLTEGLASTIQLMEDGKLLYGMNLMGMELGIYLVPVAAAEEPAA